MSFRFDERSPEYAESSVLSRIEKKIDMESFTSQRDLFVRAFRNSEVPIVHFSEKKPREFEDVVLGCIDQSINASFVSTEENRAVQ